MKRKVFISYSHQDSITAKGISRFLVRQGFDVWIDVDNLVYGKEWAGSIDEALAAADVFLAVISRNSVRRPEVLREVAEALRLEKMKPDYQVLFIVMGSVHNSWFSDDDSEIAGEIIQHLNDVQFIRLNARGSISIGKMQDLISAMEGKLIYTDENEVPSYGNYIFESGMPEEAYDSEAKNAYYRINASDLAPSTVFPFAMDNQWLPDAIMEPGSTLRESFLERGFRDADVQEMIGRLQLKNLYLALFHTRQIILNRASILNSRVLQSLYFEDSGSGAGDRDAFIRLLQNGSIVVFLYENNDLTPYVSYLPAFDTMQKAIDEWNKLCSRVSMYCIRENWETPADRHREEFVRHCTTLAFSAEMNTLVAKSLGIDEDSQEEFFAMLREIEATVFHQTHGSGTGQRPAAKGFSRSAFYRNFVVKERSDSCPEPVLDCIFDEKKPFYLQLKKMIDIYYNSVFTGYFNCSALLPPDMKPSESYVYQAYMKHGLKEVGTDELEYAFSEFFRDNKTLELIKKTGSGFYLENWDLERIAALRESLRWREYVELLEYITNRSNVWEVDFSGIEKLVELFVSCVTAGCEESPDDPAEKGFEPAYTFRVCIGSKVLDIITTENERKLRSYPGIIAARDQNSLTLHFMLGDTASGTDDAADSIFAPIKIFDGKTSHTGGVEYYKELCTFLTDQCGYVWIR